MHLYLSLDINGLTCWRCRQLCDQLWCFHTRARQRQDKCWTCAFLWCLSHQVCRTWCERYHRNAQVQHLSYLALEVWLALRVISPEMTLLETSLALAVWVKSPRDVIGWDLSSMDNMVLSLRDVSQKYLFLQWNLVSPAIHQTRIWSQRGLLQCTYLLEVTSPVDPRSFYLTLLQVVSVPHVAGMSSWESRQSVSVQVAEHVLNTGFWPGVWLHWSQVYLAWLCPYIQR